MEMSTEPVEDQMRQEEPGAIHTEGVLIPEHPRGSPTTPGLIKPVLTMVKLLSHNFVET